MLKSIVLSLLGMRHRRRRKVHIAADQQRNARRRRHLHEFDRHADMFGDFADDIEIETDRFVLVIEEPKRRRVELHAGEQLPPALDLGDRILGLGICPRRKR